MPVGSVTALSTDADAVWILTSAFIIFSMQSGFGLLETGMVSRKNETNVMVKNALDVILGGLSYWMFGFAFSFGQDERSNFFSGVGYFFTDANEDEMGAVFAKYFFQLSFATTATTVVSGAMAERTSLKAYMAYSFLNTISYCFPAHWVWDPSGWIYKLGGVDIAGCSAVHMVGGSAALVAAIMLKPRYGRFNAKIQPITMASPTNIILGTFMLWWGWLGFNCGSTFGISGGKWKLASRAAVVTMNGSIGGGIFSIVYCFFLRRKKTQGKLDISVFSTSILGGLVGITAICAICRPWEAFVIGFIGAACSNMGNELVEHMKIDDPVGCIGIHCVGGIWGMLAVGLFAEHDKVEGFSSQYGLFKGGSAKLFGVQVAACVSIISWSAMTTFCQLAVIDKLFGLRVPLKIELLGADYAEHGIVEDRLTGEERVNHAYGKKVGKVDCSCLELSPKLKKKAQNMRHRKISRKLSALSILIGPANMDRDNIAAFKHNLSDVADEDEETQIDQICDKSFTSQYPLLDSCCKSELDISFADPNDQPSETCSFIGNQNNENLSE